MAPPAMRHFISSPNPATIESVPAFDHPSEGVDIYFIDADGQPDSDGTKFIPIIEVYGKVFADDNSGTIPHTQPEINDMINGRPGNGCRAGTAFAVSRVWHYQFRDGSPTYNSLPVPHINLDTNYLQVWVKFKNESDYTPAFNGPVQFQPQS